MVLHNLIKNLYLSNNGEVLYNFFLDPVILLMLEIIIGVTVT